MGTQPEGKVSRKIMAALCHRGAFVWKVHGNEFTPAGLPDIVGTYRGHFIGVETKIAGNELSTIQKYRIGKIREAGGLVIAPCYEVDEAIHLLDLIDLAWPGNSTAMIELATRYGNGHTLE